MATQPKIRAYGSRKLRSVGSCDQWSNGSTGRTHAQQDPSGCTPSTEFVAFNSGGSYEVEFRQLPLLRPLMEFLNTIDHGHSTIRFRLASCSRALGIAHATFPAHAPVAESS